MSADSDDLDDLDDLLDDFNDDILSKPPGATLKEAEPNEAQTKKDDITKETKSQTPPSTESGTHQSESTSNGQLDELLNQMDESDPQLSGELKGFIKELTGKGDLSEKDSATGGKNQSFHNAISETVNRLKSSGKQVDDDIRKESQDDDMLATLMKSLDIDPSKLGSGSKDGKDNDDISKLLVEMLDQLSTKSVLYEPLHDLYLKFGPWLQEPQNRTNEDYEKYQKQYVLVKKIVTKFEEPGFDDSNAEHKKFINDNLEQLQELGMPPKDLVNDDLSFLKKGPKDQDLQDLKFSDEDIPEDVDKELEETCQQT